ncbi:DinB family protein [Roseivirga sp.]|uniref:DinB family protein n=1 Tax=Roseivirga sp. TaxID=1964215 RepID=UPI003B8C2182
MSFNPTIIINELESNLDVVKNMAITHSPDQAKWKPTPDTWCLLEIVCHLIDEEVLDFRARTQTALFPDQYSFIPIDPVSWVTANAYIDQNYEIKMQEWISERERSIQWLKSLKDVDWNSFLVHDIFGKMSAQLFLENWLAHDYIHLRQINRTKRAFLAKNAISDISYAGKW